jgi:hypothetical protein
VHAPAVVVVVGAVVVVVGAVVVVVGAVVVVVVGAVVVVVGAWQAGSFTTVAFNASRSVFKFFCLVPDASAMASHWPSV